MRVFFHSITLMVLVLMSGCRLPSVNEPEVSADSVFFEGFPIDTLTFTTISTDSSATDEPAQPTTDALPTDGVITLPAATVDSLFSEIARLRVDLLSTRREAADSLNAIIPARIEPAAQDTNLTEVIRPQEVVQDARQAVQNYGTRVFLSILVLIFSGYLVRGSVFILNRLSEKSAARRLFYKRLVPVVRILLWTLAIFLIVRAIFQVDANGLLAAAAAIGVAIGFAAQDLLKNIFGGLVIVFDQPFQVGDKISVGGTYGEVVGIGLRSTRIVTPDDSLVTVPNAQVVDGQVSNANAGALDCQVVTDLYLPGFVDEVKAKKIAYETAAGSKYVFLKKPIVVIVKDEFKETFITHLKVKAYVLDTRYEFLFMSDVTERARAEFRRQGLLRPLHGARAFVDLTAIPYKNDRQESQPTHPNENDDRTEENQ